MIMQVTEEELMAYVDGEPGSVTDAVAAKQRAGFSPGEAQLMAEFHRTRQAVRDAFAIDASDPVPAGLVEKILNHNPQDKRPSDKSGVLRLPRSSSAAQMRSPLSLALAASLALAVSLAAWNLNTQSPELASGFAAGAVKSDSTLASVLNIRPSGDPAPLTTEPGSQYAYVMVAGTFRDRSSRYCREVELLDAALAPRMAAVACRAPAGASWSVEGTAVIAHGPPSDSIAPAGAPEGDVLGALLKMLGADKTLLPDEERKLLDGGWK